MVVTVDAAFEMWCPFVRSREGIGDFATNRNREGDTDGKAYCIASACMAWRQEEFSGLKAGSRRGYCGLAGVPD